jgi:hypothetical protein
MLERMARSAVALAVAIARKDENVTSFELDF